METEAIKPKSPVAVGMKFGAYAGISIVIIYIVYLFLSKEIAPAGGLELATWVVFTIFMVFGVKFHRDKELDGYISFWKATGTGTLISLFTWVITGFFFFIYYNFFLSDAQIEEYREQSLKVAIEFIEKVMDPENESTERLIEEVKEKAKSDTRNQIATSQFQSNMFFKTPIGALISMIASIFLKKSRPEMI